MSLPEIAACYYGVVSLITLVIYAADKRASKRAGARRTPESTLHMWTLAGGFPGAWLGQAWLRHKTRHASFIIVTVLAFALHAATWAWWFGGR